MTRPIRHLPLALLLVAGAWLASPIRASAQEHVTFPASWPYTGKARVAEGEHGMVASGLATHERGANHRPEQSSGSA